MIRWATIKQKLVMKHFCQRFDLYRSSSGLKYKRYKDFKNNVKVSRNKNILNELI